MSQFAKNLLSSIKLTLRETSVDFDQEIESYIDGCANNLQVAGILPSFFLDSLTAETVDSQILQAIRLYCLSLYGLYNSDSEKYDQSYRSIKATLCTNIKYTQASADPSTSTQEKIVVLDMAQGNQIIEPDENKTLSRVEVVKPTTLIPANIRKDVSIGEVTGSYAPSTETKTVDLSMVSGNQIISKSADKDGMVQVIVKKPTTFSAENIKKDVNIGGIVGTYEGSGGSTRYSQPVRLTITPQYQRQLYAAWTNVNKDVEASGFSSSFNLTTYVGETVTVQTGLNYVQASGTNVLFANGRTSYTGLSEPLIFFVAGDNATLIIEDDS